MAPVMPHISAPVRAMRFGAWLCIAACLSGCVSAAQASAPTLATGIVFEDLDGNRQRDAGEPGIAGVMVSNGVQVTVTDAQGGWTLPASQDETIFVIAPGGWASPVSGQQVPQFYYLHRQHGSPDLKYPGIDATGPLPQSIDFPLRRQAEAEEARILLIADPQPHHSVHIDYYRQRFVEPLAGRRDFEFGLVLGDVVRNDLGLFEPYLEANAGMPGAMFHVAGNHDLNFDTAEAYSTETYQRYFGPTNYGFFHGASQTFFLVLNNIRTPLEDGSGQAYRGGLSEDTLAFARNVLAHGPQDQRVIVAAHIPFFPENGDIEPEAEQERAALFETLKPFRQVLILSGHTHMQRHFRVSDPHIWQGKAPLHQWVVGTASGAWWTGAPDADGLPESLMRDGTPPGYGILILTNADYRMDYQVAGAPADFQMRLHAPRHMTTHERDVPLYVNVFNGDADTTVQVRYLPDGDWRSLSPVVSVDPFYKSQTLLRDLSPERLPGSRPPPAALSHHLWYARLPTTLPPGRHAFEVRAIDAWGREWTERFEIEAHAPDYPYGRITPEQVSAYRQIESKPQERSEP